jgi:hypothetical protein
MDISKKCEKIGCNFKGILGNGGYGRVFKIQFENMIFAVKTFQNEDY